MNRINRLQPVTVNDGAGTRGASRPTSDVHGVLGMAH